MVNFQDHNKMLMETVNKMRALHKMLIGVAQESNFQCSEFEWKSKVSKKSFESIHFLIHMIA